MDQPIEIGFNFSVFDAGTRTSSKSWLIELKEHLVPKLESLLDRPVTVLDLDSNDSLDRLNESYVNQLVKLPVIVSVVSYKSVRSEKFNQELNTIAEAINNSNASQKLFVVYRQPVPEELIPLILQSSKPYRFYKKDEESNSILEMSPGNYNNTSREYDELLEFLAADIVKFLDKDTSKIQLEGEEEDLSDKLNIYLAETSEEAKVEREQIKRELVKLGFNIFPKTELIRKMPACQMEVSRYLQQCHLSIHLFSNSFGTVPEGSTRSLSEIQNDISEEFSVDNNIVKLIHISKNLKINDERQKALLEDIRNTQRTKNTVLFEGDFSEIQPVLHQQIEQAKILLQSKKIEMNDYETKPNKLYIISDIGDTKRVSEISKICKIEGCEVLQVNQNDDESEIRQSHSRSLQNCDAVMLYFSTGSSNWLQSRSRDLLRAVSYGRANKAMPKLIVRGVGKSDVQLKSKDFELIAESSDNFENELITWIESWKN